MTGEFIAFLALALIAIAGGVLMINLTKVVHMVVALVFTFLSIAGLYVLLHAEFVAFVQVLVYSGAITIIMLFGIMLTNHHAKSNEKIGFIRNIFTLLGIAGFAVAVYLGIYNLDFGEQATSLHVENTKQIGIALYSEYAIPFELVSVLLLVGLVGAIILAKKDKEEAEE